MTDQSLYARLGVSHSADSDTLRNAFRSRSKTLHPDTTLLPVEEAKKKFHDLCEAYELLTDAKRRAAYDLSIEHLIAEDGSAKPYQSILGINKIESKNKGVGIRRPLSGGELFSLLMLFITLILSLLIGMIIAITHGKDLQNLPSWLVVDANSAVNITLVNKE